MNARISAPREGGYFSLASANLFAQSAEQVALAAAPLVAVMALGATAAQTGSLQTILTLPFLILSIPAGLLADRLSRRRLMLVAEAVRVAALLATVALLLSGTLSLTHLAALGFLGVSATVVVSIGAQAIVPQIVAPERLSLANSRIELARTAAYAGGPALGGALVGWFGGGVAFALAAFLSLAAVVAIARIADPGAPQQRGRARPLADIAEGLGFVFRHPLLMPVFLTQFVFNAAFFAILAVFVPHAVEVLGLSASATGSVLSMFGIGMALGAFFAPAVMRRIAFGKVIAIGPFSGLLGAVLVAATVHLPSGLLAGAGFFFLGVGPVLWVISTATLRQAVTPNALLGRVSAINILAYSARPLGAGLAALVAAGYGTGACLTMAVAGFMLQAVIIALSPAVSLAAQPASVSS